MFQTQVGGNAFFTAPNNPASPRYVNEDLALGAIPPNEKAAKFRQMREAMNRQEQTIAGGKVEKSLS